MNRSKEKPCRTCGKTFTAKMPWHSYCSAQCSPREPAAAEAQQAWAIVARARNRFEIREPAACDLCGQAVAALRAKRSKWWVDMLHAHHWNGYEHPLDIWWLCPSCHKRIRDAGIGHDGSHTLAQAQRLLNCVAHESVAAGARRGAVASE